MYFPRASSTPWFTPFGNPRLVELKIVLIRLSVAESELRNSIVSLLLALSTSISSNETFVCLITDSTNDFVYSSWL